MTVGEGFGELALTDDSKGRAATVTCISNCSFAVVSKADYQRFLQRVTTKKKERMNEFLRSLPYFRDWTTTSLNKLQPSFESKAFTRNQVVFH